MGRAAPRGRRAHSPGHANEAKRPHPVRWVPFAFCTVSMSQLSQDWPGFESDSTSGPVWLRPGPRLRVGGGGSAFAACTGGGKEGPSACAAAASLLPLLSLLLCTQAEEDMVRLLAALSAANVITDTQMAKVGARVRPMRPTMLKGWA